MLLRLFRHFARLTRDSTDTEGTFDTLRAMETVPQHAVGLVRSVIGTRARKTVVAGRDSATVGRRVDRAADRTETRMISFFAQTQQGVLAALFFVLGAVVGRLANLWSIVLTKSSEGVTDASLPTSSHKFGVAAVG